MTDVPPSFPEEGRLFEGDRQERFLAVALETLVQDVSPDGDADVARSLGGYSLGDEPPPEGAPEYVALDDGRVSLTDPPFLHADFEFRATAGTRSTVSSTRGSGSSSTRRSKSRWRRRRSRNSSGRSSR